MSVIYISFVLGEYVLTCGLYVNLYSNDPSTVKVEYLDVFFVCLRRVCSCYQGSIKGRYLSAYTNQASR